MQPIGKHMDPLTAARREVALEVESLAQEFEASDNAAFQRSRMIAWIVTAAATAVALILLMFGADGRYLTAFWLIFVGLVWAGHFLSTRRQRQQTAKLRALANRWLQEPQSAARTTGSI
jgi:predicted cobalt transporter CbtA